jgi:hypothetical protein
MKEWDTCSEGMWNSLVIAASGADCMSIARGRQSISVGRSVFAFPEQLFKPQYQDIEEIPVFLRDFDGLIMSRSGIPCGPLFIRSSHSDSVGDALAADVKELAYIQCRQGVPVETSVSPLRTRARPVKSWSAERPDKVSGRSAAGH